MMISKTEIRLVCSSAGGQRASYGGSRSDASGRKIGGRWSPLRASTPSPPYPHTLFPPWLVKFRHYDGVTEFQTTLCTQAVQIEKVSLETESIFGDL